VSAAAAPACASSRCFTAAEQRELAQAGAAAADTLFLQGWTRKEACLKAVGSGLSLEPAEFEAGLAAADRRLTLTWEGTPWHLALRSFQADGVLGAIALRRSSP
jgi:4'-phosphopantetheinyl transferase